MESLAGHAMFRQHRLCHTSRLHFVTLAGAIATTLLICSALAAQAQTFTILHKFNGGLDGYNPQAGLTIYGAGNLYGGAGPAAVFRISHRNMGWTLNPIYEFNGDSGGDFLAGRVVTGPDGALYGATYSGGLGSCGDGAGCGVVFKMQPPATFCPTISCLWTETVAHSFDPPNDGAVPNGGLILDWAGNIYGTTITGDVDGHGFGTVYRLSPSQDTWSESILYTFMGTGDGAQPNGNMLMDHAGNLYGTTTYGGDFNCYVRGCGVVFELMPNATGWVETVLHTFDGANDGQYPKGGLISDSAGNLYGTTTFGGTSGGGTVYELTPSDGGWTFNVLYSATGTTFQVGPSGLLALDGGGNLYGVTNSEGTSGDGNVFKLTPAGGNWTYIDLHDFTGGSDDGAFPYDGPTLDASGNLYGTASQGGTSGNGVVWEISFTADRHHSGNALPLHGSKTPK